MQVAGTATTLNNTPGPINYFGVTDIVANLGAGADNITVQDLGALVNLTINGEADADIITVDTVGVSNTNNAQRRNRKRSDYFRRFDCRVAHGQWRCGR